VIIVPSPEIAAKRAAKRAANRCRAE
jgi:hypothetical protein